MTKLPVFGSGSISQRHGYSDPDPRQNHGSGTLGGGEGDCGVEGGGWRWAAERDVTDCVVVRLQFCLT